MSNAEILVTSELAAARPDREGVSADAAVWSHAAWGTLALVLLVAPFETLRPILRLPGQSLTSVEAVVLPGLVLLALASWRGRLWSPELNRLAAAPWMLAVAALCAALAAPSDTGNALRMVARLTIVAAVAMATTVTAVQPHRRRLLWMVLLSGVIVALLVIADFTGGADAEAWFAPFRTAMAVVGSQRRASGPFQYPTIASMYLEIAFAVGCGVLLSAPSRAARILVGAALLVIFEAIVFTFTRAGLITAMLALAVTGIGRWRRRGPDEALATLAVVGIVALVQVGTSRSAEMLMLRLTSEGQGRWFAAVFDVPDSVAVDTRRLTEVPITITNTGRATWDSDAAEPVLLSYHWVAADSDLVVAWEGERTAFDRPVAPGETIEMHAVVGGPGRPGTFRLMWDIEQQKRLWFSTEPEADLTFSAGTVVGPETTMGHRLGPHRIPRAEVRPGRLKLWSAAWRMVAAHPLLGVGPDNYRLQYGRYSTIVPADPRVHSNNTYIEVTAGMGVVGLAALLWLLWSSGRHARIAWRLSDEGAGVAAACAAIAVHGLVDSFLSFTGTYLLMAVTLGLAAAFAADVEVHAHRV